MQRIEDLVIPDHEGAYRRVDETDGPLAESKSSIVDHREDRSNDRRGTRRSGGGEELTIDLWIERKSVNTKLQEQVCSHTATT